MKKFVSVLLCLTLALSLVSCGETQNDSATSSGNEPVQSQNTAGETSSPTETALPGSPIPAAASFAGGSGTEEAPYQIATAEQLALLAEEVNGGNKEYAAACYVLTADIVVNDGDTFEQWDKEPPQYRWTAIADGRSGGAQFSGSFDGAGHTITGLYCYGENTVDSQKTGNYYLGLFGALNGATVTDLTVEKSYLGSTGRTPGCGGIAAQAWNSVVSGCSVSILLNCDETAQGAGGVLGSAHNTTITDCTNTSILRHTGTLGTESVGGIVGLAVDSSFTDCVNEGDVSGCGLIGGIAGSLIDLDVSYELTGCVNKGAVTATSGMTGGIAGSISSGKAPVTVTGCSNLGMIAGDGEAGGLFGRSAAYLSTVSNADSVSGSLTLTDCSNAGKVKLSANKAAGCAGGLSGSFRTSDGATLLMEGCENTGSVSAGAHEAGGIAGTLLLTGWGTVEVSDCRSMGTVETTNACCGGIFASVTQTVDAEPRGQRVIRISGCRNMGNLTASGWNTGGILGMVTLLSVDGDMFEVTDCGNSGMITAQTSGAMIELGGVIGGTITTGGSARVTDCTNLGNVTLVVSGTEDDDAVPCPVGGIVGSHGEDVLVSGCTNNGLLSIEGGAEDWIAKGNISGSIKPAQTAESAA